MVHGFMGIFIQQIEYFEGKYGHLPGHGKNEMEYENDYFNQTLEWLSEYVEKQAGFILGLSLGASLAIHTALSAFSQRSSVDGLFAICTRKFTTADGKAI